MLASLRRFVGRIRFGFRALPVDDYLMLHVWEYGLARWEVWRFPGAACETMAWIRVMRAASHSPREVYARIGRVADGMIFRGSELAAISAIEGARR